MAFLYDQDNVVADLSPTPNGLTVDRTYVTPFLDQNLSMTDAGGNSFYYSQDGLGSVRTLTDGAGGVVNRYDYGAFGEEYAPGCTATIANRYTYAGREKSAVGGAMYYRYRFYHPNVGRFGARDPYGDEQSPNLYAYALGNPVLNTDPTGGLSITTTYQMEWDAGEHDVFFDFKLRRKAPCDGYFIQKIEISENILECDCGKCPEEPPKLPAFPSETFYEAFFVEEGKDMWKHQSSEELTDSSGTEPHRNTCGIHEVVGTVKFFCKDKRGNPKLPHTGDLGDLDRDPPAGTPGGWHVDPKSKAGRLPFTTEQPDWWNSSSAEGPTQRVVTHVWNDCGDEETHTLTVKPPLKKKKRKRTK